MKFLFLLLITFKSYAYIKVDTTFNPPVDSTPPNASKYLFETAGKAKFKDSVRFEYLTRFFDTAHFATALIESLKLPLNNGILHLSEELTYTGPVLASEIQAGYGVIYGDLIGKGKTNPTFYYNEETNTLHVQNIIIGDGTSDGLPSGRKMRKISNNYKVEDEVQTILIDTSENDVDIDLTNQQKLGRTILLKKTKGRHKARVSGVDEKLKDVLKLIYDGEKWEKL